MGILNPCSTSKSSFESSLLLTKPQVESIIAQDPSGRIDYTNLQSAKSIIKQSNRLRDIQLAQDLDNELDDHQKRLIALAREKGASSWLTVIALTEHGFSLNKGNFEMLFIYTMGGRSPILLRSVTVATLFRLIMLQFVRKEVFLHWDITKFVISLLLYSLKCVQLLLLSLPPLQPLSLESFIRQSANVDLEA